MDLGHYILDGHTPVHIPLDYEVQSGEDCMLALLRWGRWLEEHRAERVVGRTYIGDYEIATDFLGLDHGIFFREGPPILFETIVFCGFQRKGKTGDMGRCSTWEQAEAQHARVVARIQRMVNS